MMCHRYGVKKWGESKIPSPVICSCFYLLSNTITLLKTHHFKKENCSVPVGIVTPKAVVGVAISEVKDVRFSFCFVHRKRWCNSTFVLGDPFQFTRKSHKRYIVKEVVSMRTF